MDSGGVIVVRACVMVFWGSLVTIENDVLPAAFSPGIFELRMVAHCTGTCLPLLAV